MTRTPRTSLLVGTFAAVAMFAGCGDDEPAGSATTATTASTVATTVPTTAAVTTAVATTELPASTVPASTVPATTTDGSASGECAALNALVAAEAAMFGSLFLGSPAVDELVAAMPSLAAAAQATASAEISGDLDTMSEAYGELVAALDGVDLSDFEAVEAALDTIPSSAAAGEASENLMVYATDSCGYTPSDDDPFADAPEPSDCEVLDPAVASRAAAIDVDISKVDVGADVSLPGFAIKGCAYGNGDMVLSTMTFNSLEFVIDSYPSNVENNGGTMIADVDLATLPESTLVTDQVGQISVVVFEADIPFIVGFGGDVEPSEVVAAAEALLADQMS